MDRAGHVELGVGMKPELCGQGRGRMLMALALAKILETRSCTTVKLAVRTFNTRAVRCYERAGFRLEGVKRHAFFANGAFCDVGIMSILREEYGR